MTFSLFVSENFQKGPFKVYVDNVLVEIVFFGTFPFRSLPHASDLALSTTLLYLRLSAVEEIMDVYCLKTECQAAQFIVTLFGTILIFITALTDSTSLLQPHAIQNKFDLAWTKRPGESLNL